MKVRVMRNAISCSDIRDAAARKRRSHEMWLADDEPRRLAEISLHFLSG